MRKAIFTLALTASCMLSCAQETINLPLLNHPIAFPNK